jgi:hypothetical protein
VFDHVRTSVPLDPSSPDLYPATRVDPSNVAVPLLAVLPPYPDRLAHVDALYALIDLLQRPVQDVSPPVEQDVGELADDLVFWHLLQVGIVVGGPTAHTLVAHEASVMAAVQGPIVVDNSVEVVDG